MMLGVTRTSQKLLTTTDFCLLQNPKKSKNQKKNRRYSIFLFRRYASKHSPLRAASSWAPQRRADNGHLEILCSVGAVSFSRYISLDDLQLISSAFCS